MSRPTRYVTEMVEKITTVQMLACDECGETEDVDPLDRPNGWFTLFWTEGGNKTRDFLGWACLSAWVQKQGEDGPSDLLEALEASLEAEREKRAVPS